jgi:hypothetical protein
LQRWEISITGSGWLGLVLAKMNCGILPRVYFIFNNFPRANNIFLVLACFPEGYKYVHVIYMLYMIHICPTQRRIYRKVSLCDTASSVTCVVEVRSGFAH